MVARVVPGVAVAVACNGAAKALFAPARPTSNTPNTNTAAIMVPTMLVATRVVRPIVFILLFQSWPFNVMVGHKTVFC